MLVPGLWEFFAQNVHPGTIRLDGDTAVGRAYVQEFGRMRDGSSHPNYAVYHDRYQRTPDGWKSAERVYEVTYLDSTPLAGSPLHAAPGARGSRRGAATPHGVAAPPAAVGRPRRHAAAFWLSDTGAPRPHRPPGSPTEPLHPPTGDVMPTSLLHDPHATSLRGAAPLLAFSLAYAVLTAAYVVTNRATPQPDTPGGDILRQYVRDHGAAIDLGAFLLLVAAVLLVPLAATLARLVRRGQGRDQGAAAATALAGGLLASGALASSAALSWTLGRLPEEAPAALARALADLSFLAGGLGYAVSFALLAAGTCLAARGSGLLPRACATTGLVIAAAGLAATLMLLVFGFSYLLPVVRFGGTAWLLWAAFTLVRSRPTAPAVNA
ncbi:nuclear transport factor 2 family protein [Streptomyces sp. NBC_00091]|uniref:nuclear transport factor 2 family protein n=1 Tax=Streptomyces sp. NBC_00091 TaxID=2975648 RepID=UPI0022516D25|nr:nuclear transport factor 2 family protein [Streptomyces sp. NBC_00091]MCX5375062.1 nuclear transport factor 2 family protein [Streptomyces sp. NBC_00091]